MMTIMMMMMMMMMMLMMMMISVVDWQVKAAHLCHAVTCVLPNNIRCNAYIQVK